VQVTESLPDEMLQKKEVLKELSGGNNRRNERLRRQ
jgi:hypothetical protein